MSEVAPHTGPRLWTWVPEGLRRRLGLNPPDALARRLMLLTMAFAVAVEILIITPSVASFHERWLTDRLQSAELASVAVQALPYSAVEDDTAEQLLAIGGVQAVVVADQGVRRLLLQAPNLSRTPDLIDLRESRPVSRLIDPWRTLFGHPDRSIRVQARPRYRTGDFIEIVTLAQPLKAELRTFLLNSLLVSLLVSIVAGALLYSGLAFLVLQPLRRVTRSIERFARDPEAEGEPPSGRHDEIGRVERELARMQEEVRLSLRSRARLVALGEAVAKINHDLRNMLTSAQLASERLAESPDPEVARVLPRLERALGRAAALSRNVLEYGRSEEPEPQRVAVPLATAVTVAAEDAGLTSDTVRLVKTLPAKATVQADPDQLHRILVNLMRNARQAIQGDAKRKAPRRGAVTVVAVQETDGWLIRIADDGPGIPARVSEQLFDPFVSGRSSEGTGLGLTISRELATAHGGTLDLVETGPDGTVFALRLPD